MPSRNRNLDRFMRIRYAIMMINISVSVALIVFIIMRFVL